MSDISRDDVLNSLNSIIDWGGRKKRVAPPWKVKPRALGNYVVVVETGLQLAIGFYDGEAWIVNREALTPDRVRYCMPIPSILPAQK